MASSRYLLQNHRKRSAIFKTFYKGLQAFQFCIAESKEFPKNQLTIKNEELGPDEELVPTSKRELQPKESLLYVSGNFF